MDWKKYIYSDPEILMGKPVVKGTRLAVDFLVGLFAAGWTEQQVLENYPSLNPEVIHAIYMKSDVLEFHERFINEDVEWGVKGTS